MRQITILSLQCARRARCGLIAFVLLCAMVVRAFSATSGAITALAYSPDGKRLAVGGYGQVAVFDTSTWLVISTFRKVEDSVRSLAFSPNSQTLAIGSGLPGQSGRLLLWDTTSASPLRTLPPQHDTIEAVAFSKDGGALLLGANDNKACYASVAASDRAILDEHNGRVQAVAFSPRDNWVFATGGLDKIVKIWEEKTRKVVVNFDQAEGGISGLAFLPDGNQIVGASLDGRLYWWQVYYSERQKGYGGNRVRRVDAHPGGVLAMSQSADGKRLITGGEDRTVIVWDASNGRKIRTFTNPFAPLYAVALSPDGKTAVGAGREGMIQIWDVDAGYLILSMPPPSLPVPPAPKPKPKKKR